MDRRSMRNRRDPSRRLTFSEGGPYKPMVKEDRAGRESEGSIVPKGRRSPRRKAKPRVKAVPKAV